MEKTDIGDEDDDIDNDDTPIGGKGNKRSAVSAYKPRNIRKIQGESCRRRNILQRDEVIRKEVVRMIFFIEIQLFAFSSYPVCEDWADSW